MGVPKKARWNAETVAANSVGTSQIQTAGVETSDIKDAAVNGDKILSTDDYTMGTLEAAQIKATSRIVTKQGTHTGVALADLTATFGDPAALDNGSMFVYKNTTDNKTYLVVVIASVFQVEELTPVTA